MYSIKNYVRNILLSYTTLLGNIYILCLYYYQI